MKLLLATLIAAATAAPPSSPPQPQDDDVIVITVPASEAAKCDAEGGCAVFTRQFIERLVEETKKQAAAACFRSRKEI